MASSALSIECSDQPLDLSFHPSRPNLVAIGLVDGTVEVHDVTPQAHPSTSLPLRERTSSDDDDDDDDTIVSSTAVHTQLIATTGSASDGINSNNVKQASCRAVRYAADGRTLWTGGSAGDVACLDAERIGIFSSSKTSNSSSVIQTRIGQASYGKSPIQVLHQLACGQEQQQQQHSHLWVTGDEAGAVRLWDSRVLHKQCGDNGNHKPVAAWKVHEDYVSDLEDDGNVTLMATSADGTLSVYDLRMAPSVEGQSQTPNGVIRQSDHQDDELLSIKLMKNGRKVVCGTGDGVLSVFSYGTWGDVSDRFPGHPQSIDALVKVDEDTLLTGSSDGLIRVVSILPDKFIGVLGDNHEGFPIEKLQFNADRSYVGSITHDNFVRLWDASVLKDDFNDDDIDENGGKDDKMAMDVPSGGAAEAANHCTNSDDEWENMDEEMEDDSDDGEASDSDDDSDDNKREPMSTNDRRANRFKSENEKFFGDL